MCLRTHRKRGRRTQPSRSGVGIEYIRHYGDHGTPQLRPFRGLTHRPPGPLVAGVQPEEDALCFHAGSVFQVPESLRPDPRESRYATVGQSKGRDG